MVIPRKMMAEITGTKLQSSAVMTMGDVVLHWRTVPVDMTMTTTNRTKTTSSGLQTKHPLHFIVSAGALAAQQTWQWRQQR